MVGQHWSRNGNRGSYQNVPSASWTSAPATIGEFPSQVAINYNGDQLICPGSILNTFLILTTASCLVSKLPKSLSIAAGIQDNPNNNHHSDSFAQIRQVKRIFLHEHFSNATFENNIALVSLHEPLEYNDRVGNITLPRTPLVGSYSGVALSWKKPEPRFGRHVEISNLELFKWNAGTVPKQCSKSNRRRKSTEEKTAICAGFWALKPCKMGGALICKSGNGEQILCGLGDTGKKCNSPGSLSRWTNVSKYVSWIDSVQEKIKVLEKCRTDYFYCNSTKSCYPRASFCAKWSQCTGESSPVCEIQNCPSATNFRCNNGKCINRGYVCDGDDDCGDFSDEDKCRPGGDPTKLVYFRPCPLGQHLCGQNGRCIPEEWKCDGNFDCDDQSDEFGCSSPSGQNNGEDMEAQLSSSPNCLLSHQFSRIVGGNRADPKEFPFQVSINEHGRLVCGGAILSPILILTAAHCVSGYGGDTSALWVTAGQVSRFGIQANIGQTRPVKKIYVHNGFHRSSSKNDIGLLVLTEAFEFNEYIGNVSLPEEDEEFDEGCLTTAGWGGASTSGISVYLNKVTVPIVPNWECRLRYKNTGYKITEEMLCAGETGKDSCSGDSGGPGICERSGSGKKVLCGVVSFGVGCGNENYPGGYTRVSKYVGWIQEMEKEANKLLYGRSDKEVDEIGTTLAPVSVCDPQEEWQCKNGKCIDRRYYCDGFVDCREDGSDELDCHWNPSRIWWGGKGSG